MLNPYGVVFFNLSFLHALGRNLFFKPQRTQSFNLSFLRALGRNLFFKPQRTLSSQRLFSFVLPFLFPLWRGIKGEDCFHIFVTNMSPLRGLIYNKNSFTKIMSSLRDFYLFCIRINPFNPCSIP